MRKLIIGVGLAAMLAFAATAAAGGWATVQLSSLPEDEAQAGATWEPNITVLQHGRTPLAGAKPAVTIRNRDSGEVKRFAARPTGRTGVYAVSVTFPSAGTWSYEVFDGFNQYGGAQTHTYKPIQIVGGQAADGSSSAAWIVGGSAVLLLAIGGLFALPRLRRARADVAIASPR